MDSIRRMELEQARKRVDSKGWKPRTCVWELTLACNLRCGHCGSRAGEARPDELSTQEALRVVGELAMLGTELITLSGGEPTLRNDWDVIARAASERGVLVNMVTNGIYTGGRTAKDLAARAKAAGLSNVGISVDGPKEVHETIRGANTFDRTMDSIREYTEAGMKVAVLTTINRMNFPLLEKIKEVVQQSGATIWRLQLGKPMGSLQEHQDWVIDPRQMPELVRRLASMKQAGGVSLAVGDSIGYYGSHDRVLRGWGWRQRHETWQGCQAGMHAIGIQADGGIKGCLSLQARQGEQDVFVEGNVRDTSLLELWYRPGVFAFNRDFDANSLTGECRKCGKASACRGGARCVTSSLGFLGEDPFCSYRYEEQGSLTASLKGSAVGAAAAVWLSMGLGACDKADDPEKVDVVATDQHTGQDSESDYCCPEYGVEPDLILQDTKPADAIDCSNVCCECDYGIIPQEVLEACCGVPPADVKPDQGTDTCCQPEYGVEPDVIVDTTTPDAIDCTNVCCECEYGIIPEDVWQACCGQPPADVTPDTGPDTCCQPEYGVEPDVVADTTTPDAIDCTNVCCECDYGVIPQDVWAVCCDPCKDACCECDYGTPPPAECCPKK